MTPASEIRRHPDGSIDCESYLAIGRKARSRAFLDALLTIYRACRPMRVEAPRLGDPDGVKRTPKRSAQRPNAEARASGISPPNRGLTRRRPGAYASIDREVPP